MFRAPLCPSSGAGDYTDIHSIWHSDVARATSLKPDALPTATHYTYNQS